LLECGDGNIDAGEECDDGNTDNGDGCNEECQNDCGDGELEDDEECDDGNEVDGDGCSSECVETVNSVVSGGGNNCSIIPGGALRCWGYNSNGELGLEHTYAVGDDEHPSSASDVELIADETAAAVEVGGGHTCAILSDDNVYCWGANSSGQLGDATTTSRDVIEDAVDLSDVVPTAIQSGGAHTCALLTGGSVKCWGENGDGQLGIGSTTDKTAPTTAVTLGTTATAISAGNAHTCALLTGGTVRCWGDNTSGQLGIGNTTDSTSAAAAVDLDTGVATAVAAGRLHTCVIVDNDVSCWGENGSGQLGDGTTTDASLPAASVDLDDATAAQIVAGDDHTCALTSDGAVYCWGENGDGQIGDASTTDATAPVLLDFGGDLTATSISAGAAHTCAVLSNDHIRCWGRGDHGETGLATTADSGDNEALSTIDDVDLIGPTNVCGNNIIEHDETCDDGNTAADDLCSATCLIECGDGDIDGTEECDDGNTDDGDTCSSDCLETMITVYAGGSHTCTMLTDGNAVCWGQNSSGQLGVASFSLTAHGDEAGEAPGDNDMVTLPDEELTISSLALGSQHSCAILSDSNLYCWGESQNGQLGLGINADRKVMTDAVDFGGDPVASVAAGGQFTCATLADASAWCWGLNSSGELGIGDADTRYVPDTAIDLDDIGVDQITAGSAHACALLETGEVVCWGDNSSGQLGDSDGGNDSATPASVDLGGGEVTAIDAGGLFTCVIVDDEIKCWGENGSGQLGNNDGTNTDLDVPSAALDIDGETPIKLAMGSEHGCALTGTGKVYCWGESDAGQTGQNDTTDDIAPALVDIGAAYTATDIAAGGDHTCVVLEPVDEEDLSRHIRCWGEGGVGQLGLEDTSDIGDNEVVDNVSFDVNVLEGG
jgi:cysteine-rich repeat protein